MMKKKILSPSILSADFSDLRSAVKLCEEKGAGFIHIDVMDGHFVPQISYGQPIVKSIRPLTSLPFDVHLMVEHPENMIDSFIEAGADIITFHQESTVHVDRLIQYIHSCGKKAGISIVPSTPICSIKEVLSEVDLVLVMTVNPGFGGQKLIPYCVKKIAELNELRSKYENNYLISVDGGINNDTVKSVVDAGVDVLVSGSAFFNGSFNWEF